MTATTPAPPPAQEDTSVSRAGRASYREAMQRLGSAQKSAKGAPAYSRFVNRRLGRHLAAVAYAAGLVPNQVTAISAAFSFAAIVLVATVDPTWPIAVLISALLVLGYAWDSADGQVARLRGGGSIAGEWLDHMVDCVKILSLHLAVLVSLYRFADLDHAAYLLIPAGYTLVASAYFFGWLLTDQLRRSAGAAPATPVPDATRPSVLRSLLVLPGDFGLLCLVFLTFAWTSAFLTLYGTLMVLNAAFLLIGMTRWYRDLRMIGGREG
jgi:phosphatidylglycerophosphate synthase